ncbi:tRNA-specific adenosine deaminase TAD1-like [Hevea brasiliensis]|uniref:tRNA-specific adenosine deaminase TAD1-like n=1 Tax=Hevea brasiliensis TaxID=3981 RepID=UPI0025F256EA|nr:tRNA-specific adenosine deaminase TAD1-like [Hevea brasiliensis]
MNGNLAGFFFFFFRGATCSHFFCVASVPPKEFQHADTALATLTCRILCALIHGYSVCWNKSGLREVVLGTTGRKQGTISASTESSLCKRGLYQHKSPTKMICYQELKNGVEAYSLTLKTYKGRTPFNNWPSKPLDLEAFSILR